MNEPDDLGLVLDWSPLRREGAALRAEMAITNLLKYDREGKSIRTVVWFDEGDGEMFKFTVTWAKDSEK